MHVNRFKLNHWTNARKLTPVLLAEQAGVALDDVRAMLAGREVADDVASTVAGALQVSVAQLDGGGYCDRTGGWQAAAGLSPRAPPVHRSGNTFSTSRPP